MSRTGGTALCRSSLIKWRNVPCATSRRRPKMTGPRDPPAPAVVAMETEDWPARRRPEYPVSTLPRTCPITAGLIFWPGYPSIHANASSHCQAAAPVGVDAERHCRARCLGRIRRCGEAARQAPCRGCQPTGCPQGRGASVATEGFGRFPPLQPPLVQQARTFRARSACGNACAEHGTADSDACR